LRLTAPSEGSSQWEQRPYQAKLHDIEDRESPNRPGETYARLVFEVVGDDDNAGRRLGINAGWTLHPKGNLRAPAEALLSRKIKDGEDIEVDDLIGKECMIMVVPPEKEGGYAEINGYYPVQTAKAKPAPQKQDPSEPEEDDLEVPF
jgi:hypothetical protein